jgi:hypothetical protein
LSGLLIWTSLLAIAVVRQVAAIPAGIAALRFVNPAEVSRAGCGEKNLELFVVLPVLREASLLAETVAYFCSLPSLATVHVVVVTTEREAKEAGQHASALDTISTAAALARTGRCLHFHYPKAEGVKGDQINFAAEQIAKLQSSGPRHRRFIAIYDADSRPAGETLELFAEAIKRHPLGNVFHQSSRFVARHSGKPASVFASIQRAIVDASALRANRFVLTYEIPRLLRQSGQRGFIQRFMSWGTYTHVTGHGLCLDLDFLLNVPIPSGVAVEDMYYSYNLCLRGERMYPIQSLDCAQVPLNLATQFTQLTRWFLGPGRFLIYLRRSRGPRVRAVVLSLSAGLIACEWLACAVGVPAIVTTFVCGTILQRSLAFLICLSIGVQIALAERLCDTIPLPDRILRALAFPAAVTLFGVSGIVGAAALVLGRGLLGKTERP